LKTYANHIRPCDTIYKDYSRFSHLYKKIEDHVLPRSTRNGI